MAPSDNTHQKQTRCNTEAISGRAHPPVDVCLPAAMLSVLSLKLIHYLSLSFSLLFSRSLFLSTKQTQWLQGNLGQQPLLSSISNSLCAIVTHWDTQTHRHAHSLLLLALQGIYVDLPSFARLLCNCCHYYVFVRLISESTNSRLVFNVLKKLYFFSGCLGTCGFIY